MRASASPPEADLRGPAVVFADVPDDWRAPRSAWCLAYRSLIAALRADGLDAAVLHPRLDPRRGARAAMVADLVAAQPPVVGFTSYDVALPGLLALVADLRRAGLRSHVVLGGLCASARPREILDAGHGVDAVVVGEGERTIVEHVRAVLAGSDHAPVPGVVERRPAGLRSGPPRDPVGDLDTLPSPALDDFLRADSAPLLRVNGCTPVLASRGCYGRCSFCSIAAVQRAAGGRPWRPRGAARVVDDIEATVAATRRRRVTFVDENFVGPGAAGRRHAQEIAAEILRRRLDVEFNFGCRPNDLDRPLLAALKAAGLGALSIGVESAAAPTLALFGKGTTQADARAAIALCREFELPLEMTFIFFHPLTTLDELRTNLEFVETVRRSGVAYFNNGQPFTEFIPFHGTPLTRQLTAAGLVDCALDGHSVRYADERVGLVAAAVRSVPADRLVQMAEALSALRRPAADALARGLLADAEDLRMRRLPAHAASLCEAFERGARVGDARVATVLRRFRREAARVAATVNRIAAPLSADVAGSAA